MIFYVIESNNFVVNWFIHNYSYVVVVVIMLYTDQIQAFNDFYINVYLFFYRVISYYFSIRSNSQTHDFENSSHILKILIICPVSVTYYVAK